MPLPKIPEQLKMLRAHGVRSATFVGTKLTTVEFFPIDAESAIAMAEERIRDEYERLLDPQAKAEFEKTKSERSKYWSS